jgi:hypothetical protein
MQVPLIQNQIPRTEQERETDTINHLIFGYYKIQPFLSDIYVTESTLLSDITMEKWTARWGWTAWW